jgi:hypothetical protein
MIFIHIEAIFPLSGYGNIIYEFLYFKGRKL